MFLIKAINSLGIVEDTGLADKIGTKTRPSLNSSDGVSEEDAVEAIKKMIEEPSANLKKSSASYSSEAGSGATKAASTATSLISDQSDSANFRDDKRPVENFFSVGQQ